MGFFTFRQPEDLQVPVMDTTELLRRILAILNATNASGTSGSTTSVGTSFATGANLVIDDVTKSKQAQGVPSPRGALVTAHPSNTGIICVGASTVTKLGAAGAGSCGIPLVAGGMSVVVPCTNTNQIYAAGDTSGDVLCIQAL